jgi:hypothetical protein
VHDHATARVVWALIAESSNNALKNLTPSPTIAHISLSLTQDDCYRVTGGGTDPQKATKEMDEALLPQPDNNIAYIRSIIVSSMDLDASVPLDDIIAFVQSIMALDLNPICPNFRHHAMKDPAHKSCWIEAMCSSILTAAMQLGLLVLQGFHRPTSQFCQPSLS